MKKAIFWLVLGIFALSACSPARPTAPAQPAATQPRAFERPTDTPTWTPIPTDTATPVPPPSATPTLTKGQVRQQLLDAMTKAVQSAKGVDKVNLVMALSDGVSFDLSTASALSYDQPPVSYYVIQALAQAFASQKKEDLMATLESSDVKIYLTTTSSKGIYRYGSITDWNTLVGVANHTLSYDNWVQDASASFKP